MKITNKGFEIFGDLYNNYDIEIRYTTSEKNYCNLKKLTSVEVDDLTTLLSRLGFKDVTPNDNDLEIE